jgi:hypothetical protein
MCRYLQPAQLLSTRTPFVPVKTKLLAGTQKEPENTLNFGKKPLPHGEICVEVS